MGSLQYDLEVFSHAKKKNILKLSEFQDQNDRFI